MYTRVALVALASSACGLNQSGNLEADETGDVSTAAIKGSPTETLISACGAGERTDAGDKIRREPYLQQVTQTSAILGWVTTSTTEEQVVVTTADGTPVMTGTGWHEKVATREKNEKQMWAEMTGLQPDTVYCYSITDGTQDLVGKVGFRTAPTVEQDRVKVLVFGDSGHGGLDQYTLAERMKEFAYDLIIHTGDVAYDDGTIDEFEDNVFGVYADMFKHLPFFPASGNHDYRTLKGAPFRDVFSLPGDSGEKWYSYDWGPIHFASLDTEADYATQLAWLDEDLAASQAPWKIVYMHRPPTRPATTAPTRRSRSSCPRSSSATGSSSCSRATTTTTSG